MTRRVLRGFNAQAFSQARQHKGLSVSDLSRMAGVSDAAIWKWEAGTATPLIDLLARVMRILDAPIEQVITIPADERYPGDWRAIRGISQPELAATAKIPTTTLKGIERGDRNLSDANADKLADLLGISVEEYRAAYQRARERPAGTSV
ncbi:transcriptional regulator (plasmid) [Mycobacterium adipatum]|uniref:Transcriptional regulator n=2 Tax=Mycobacterium adipatum TaxID=1682113 RepID=A0A172UWZ7_9MYCO|nr:helix-turn-helix transcriptional regulator [Mycobacterium adipatum]ANE83364.1 transcriptional regulator [Mycobacterium adipatum]